jgi:hypothetical protein
MTIDGNLEIVTTKQHQRTKRRGGDGQQEESEESNVYDRRGRSYTPVADDEECCYES